MRLEWNDNEYSTGIPQIDDDHRRVFSSINELADSIELGEIERPMQRSLEFLIDHSASHFKAEEELMKVTGCPAYAENKKQHLQFENHLLGFKGRFEREGANFQLMLEYMQFLVQWWTHHIKTVDTKLRGFSLPPGN